MIVYFIRHGAVENPKHVEYGRLPGFPLSRAGRKEAEKAAENLKGKGVEVIYTSPLLRTKQTAEIIQQQLPVPLFLDDLLLELDLGQGTGVVKDEYRRRELWRQLGESYQATGERILRFLNKVKKERRYRTLVAVSHEAPVVMALLNLAGRKVDDYATINFPTGGRLKLEY